MLCGGQETIELQYMMWIYIMEELKEKRRIQEVKNREDNRKQTVSSYAGGRKVEVQGRN